MIDKIILNISHSDDYTDYLFMTAALTNRRVIPLLDPTPEQIREQSDANTMILRCINIQKEPGQDGRIVNADEISKSICVHSKSYLLDEGKIDSHKAELARSSIGRAIDLFLSNPQNLRKVFRQNMPLLWARRKLIFANPQYFYAFSGQYGRGSAPIPIGVILKALDEHQDTLGFKQRGGCNCEKAPLIIDYETNFGDWFNTSLTIFTWCPSCGARREIKAGYFLQQKLFEQCLEDIMRKDKVQGLSHLSLFDVIDALKMKTI